MTTDNYTLPELPPRFTPAVCQHTSTRQHNTHTFTLVRHKMLVAGGSVGEGISVHNGGDGCGYGKGVLGGVKDDSDRYIHCIGCVMVMAAVVMVALIVVVMDVVVMKGYCFVLVIEVAVSMEVVGVKVMTELMVVIWVIVLLVLKMVVLVVVGVAVEVSERHATAVADNTTPPSIIFITWVSLPAEKVGEISPCLVI